MMRTVLCLALFAGSAPAVAADLGLQLSGELGRLHNADPTYDLFSNRDVMPSRGLRVGLTVADTVTIETGWHRVRRGLAEPTLGIQTAFFADEFILGPKISRGFGDVFYPYVATHGALMRGVMKFDDDPDSRRNAGQVAEAGVALGVLAMGGVELRSPAKEGKIAFSVHLEGGYGWFQTAAYGDLGTMQPGGFALKTGIGLRL
jgi:hypothetical protein